MRDYTRSIDQKEVYKLFCFNLFSNILSFSWVFFLQCTFLFNFVTQSKKNRHRRKRKSFSLRKLDGLIEFWHWSSGKPGRMVHLLFYVLRCLNTRNESFIKRNLNKSLCCFHCKRSENFGRPEALSQNSTAEAWIDQESFYKKWHLGYLVLKFGIKLSYVIRKPNIPEQSGEDCAYFGDSFLKNWDEVDVLYVATSDEFVICTVKKPNSKNDITWVENLDRFCARFSN